MSQYNEKKSRKRIKKERKLNLKKQRKIKRDIIESMMENIDDNIDYNTNLSSIDDEEEDIVNISPDMATDIQSKSTFSSYCSIQ